ncbi:MAG: Hsp20/alpha crystallin family protein [Hespellia sp.]|nr:Hsp20/alpha crystallin family protein [Hespellia sp.]
MLMPSIFGDNLFDDFFDGFTRPTRNVSNKYRTPQFDVMRTDVKEQDNGYELEIDLPGYKKENVKAELSDGYLTITAEAKSEEKQEDDKSGKYIRRERYYGSSSRTFYVGKDITQEDIKAKFEDGILKLSVPKKEEKPVVEENKYITIEG